MATVRQAVCTLIAVEKTAGEDSYLSRAMPGLNPSDGSSHETQPRDHHGAAQDAAGSGVRYARNPSPKETKNCQCPRAC